MYFNFLVFSSKYPKTIFSSIFECKVSWWLWHKCAEIWACIWSFLTTRGCFPNVGPRRSHHNGIDWFASCFSSHFLLFRNEILFNGKCVDNLQMFVTCKLRLCWWSKVRWSDSWFSMDDAFVDRKAICCVSPPDVGALKFNIDVVVWGNHCPGLIGGILRDNEGRTLLIFSRSMGLTDPMLAEVIVLKELFNKLIVESNCNNDS
ncbi:hypothetical protein ES332_1Z002600v1 [Gossypium tomentosum]|uniref:RNase H type-1 domain-containing protein n=1 Tax=Gossypium tomentosum TaxID=34277 RepID=A0A5C7J3M0_GOSTO|nr:hypothetical protein ES332_1Z002600v1 [Gossypium tomentosum]